MAFRLEDFKKTSRKAADGSHAPALVYPHQMRDKKAFARLDAAIRTFDTLIGKRRGELDAGVMADFFGDPRLARGVIACLGRFYRYKTPGFAEIVGEAAAQHLADADLSQPMKVRSHTYADVNAQYDGFLAEDQRAACYTALATPFGLAAHQWDTLLHLDAEENQVLTRPGAVPTSADLAALYNFHSLETPLRRASIIVLQGLTLSATEASDVRALARHLNLRAAVSSGGASVTLTDMEMSSLLPRRPGRLARCLLLLLQTFGSKRLTGYADAPLGTRTFRLSLSAESLATLGLTTASSTAGAGTSLLRRRCEAAEALHKDLRKLRAQGKAEGWRIARLPEPVVTAQGVLLPDFTLTRTDRRVHLMIGGNAAGDWDAPVLSLTLGRKPLDATATLAWVETAAVNLFALPERSLPEVPSALRALCDRAAATGMVQAADAQRALHLLDESPLIDWVRRAADPRVRYLPGIGLCSQELVAAIQTMGPGE